MKTIAILTDFSSRAQSVAKYALHIAQKIKADVVLYNTLTIGAPVAAGWAGEDEADDMQAETELRLADLAGQLQNYLVEKSLPGKFIPHIAFQYHAAEHEADISGVQVDREIMLLVAPAHAQEELSYFMLGASGTQLIANAKVPLLLVPENMPIRLPEKFAFATDLLHDDTQHINTLVNLAKCSSAEIMVTNINTRYKSEVAMDALMLKIVNNVDYGRVYYRNVPPYSLKSDIEWILDDSRYELLVTVNRETSLFDFFLKSICAKKTGINKLVPLLVFPDPANGLTGF